MTKSNLSIFMMVKSIVSLEAFYLSIHKAFHSLFGEDQMLHYPLYLKEGQSLIDGQRNFTDYCLSYIPSLENKTVLDVGCGNGVQSIYINEKYRPMQLTGVDVNELNIDIAKKAVSPEGPGKIYFFLENAQELSGIADQSIDRLICIESAFHYLKKEEFLKQIKRVLKPDGYFLIADLLFKKTSGPNVWEKKVQFNNWTYEKYKKEFASLNFEIIKDEDFTQKIIDGFRNSGNWFKQTSRKKNLSYYSGLFYGKMIMKLYLIQLKSTHRYHLFVGRNFQKAA